MLSSMSRSGSSLRTNKAPPSSSDPANSKPSKPFERKLSSKITSLPEKRAMGHAEDEPAEEVEGWKPRESEEKGKAKNDMISQSDSRMKALEVEVDRAKESESKMLESLMSQTKQLEETKIELEEAKLEIRSLQETIRSMQSPRSRSSRNLEKHLDRSLSFDANRAQEEIARLRNELRLATEAEDKSKKAMDDLAAAIKEVATENNQVKEKLSATKTELLAARAEVDHTGSMLRSAEERLQMAMEEVKRLKLEAEDSAADWSAKHEGFKDCMRLFEEEITRGKQENNKLIESQRSSRGEISKLRDIMKHAVNEATVVKEALEIARNENSQLQDMISEKDNALKKVQQELECLKVSEAAALGSVEELKSLLAATSNFELSKTSTSFENGSLAKSKPTVAQTTEPPKVAEFPSELPGDENGKLLKGKKDYEVRSGSVRISQFDMNGSSGLAKNRRFSSFSSFSAREDISAHQLGESLSMYPDDFDHIHGPSFGDMQDEQGSMLKKKKPILRKFTDMLRRRSFQK